jgi:hypothetical protein
VPQVCRDCEGFEERPIRDRCAGRGGRGAGRNRAGPHTLQVSPVGRQCEAVVWIEHVSMEMLHERELSLTLLTLGDIGLRENARPGAPEGEHDEGGSHGRYTTD